MATAIVIADEQSSADSLAQSLAVQGGINVMGKAYDGEEGFQLFKNLKPWIVVIDVNIPNIDSRYAIDMIKQKNPNSKIVMLTTYKNDKIDTNQVDAIYYKPYDLATVVQAIKTLAHK